MRKGRGTGNRTFWIWLAVWTVLGLGIRLATVYGQPNKPPGGDPGYVWGVANLLVAGKGFINPLAYNFHNQHHVIQTAGWPPVVDLLPDRPGLFRLPLVLRVRASGRASSGAASS